MKLKFFLPALFLFTSITTMAQDQGDFRLGVYGQTTVTKYDLVDQYGLMAEYFAYDNLGLVYKYGFGVNQNGEVSGHINPAILLFAIFIPYSADGLLASLLISEGISYHFRPLDNLEIAPYISPLGSEINFPGEDEFVLSCNAGVNFYIGNRGKLSNFGISPNAGMLYIYKSGNAYPSVGMSINYQF